MMFVKICGITRAEDAQAAAEYGASAVGFVFWPESPRYVEPHRARAIIATLPASVAAVGVFVNQPASHVKDIVSLAQLSVVQLHGDEPPAFAAEMTRPVIKAVSVDGGAPGAVADWPESVMLLVDARDPVRRGGTGLRVDWLAAAMVARGRRLLLAGGLTPENVAEAIAHVRPFGIDVSSGVERSPGVKDHGRLKALFDAMR
jgi:phosphoribosylanthranilate isomerase